VNAPLADQARALVPRVVADAGRMIRCESPSEDLSAVARSAAVVALVGAQTMGREPDAIEVDGCAHLRWRFGDADDIQGRVLILGHHDTVWPVGTLAEIPFRSGGQIRGPGSLDMKVGLALAFAAVARLELRAGITILVTGDEELGSPTSRQLIESEARRSTAALVFEAGADSGALKVGRKGRAHYNLAFTGRAAHAGLEPEAGANALVALAIAVERIVSFGAADVGTTVTPTTASAGSSANTVPDTAQLVVGVRAERMSELERVDASIRALRPVVPDVRIDVGGGVDRPPLETSMTDALFDRAVRIGRELGIEVAGETVGGGSDGNLTAAVGVPTLDGLGAVGGGPHARHEFVDVDRLAGRLALATSLLAELTGHPAGALP
jgi:glutamate carboxypeptidase